MSKLFIQQYSLGVFNKPTNMLKIYISICLVMPISSRTCCDILVTNHPMYLIAQKYWKGARHRKIESGCSRHSPTGGLVRGMGVTFKCGVWTGVAKTFNLSQEQDHPCLSIGSPSKVSLIRYDWCGRQARVTREEVRWVIRSLNCAGTDACICHQHRNMSRSTGPPSFGLTCMGVGWEVTHRVDSAIPPMRFK